MSELRPVVVIVPFIRRTQRGTRGDRKEIMACALMGGSKVCSSRSGGGAGVGCSGGASKAKARSFATRRGRAVVSGARAGSARRTGRPQNVGLSGIPSASVSVVAKRAQVVASAKSGFDIDTDEIIGTLKEKVREDPPTPTPPHRATPKHT